MFPNTENVLYFCIVSSFITGFRGSRARLPHIAILKMHFSMLILAYLLHGGLHSSSTVLCRV